ncbi:MAG: Ig-like domain-containing protein [Prevotella sp.]|nr:Ig-like domain-containing protein [Prevotella sp.]
MMTIYSSRQVSAIRCVVVALLIMTSVSTFAMSETVTIKEGESKTLYLPTTFTNSYPYCKSTTWVSYGTSYVDITSHTNLSVTIKGKKAFSSPVIVRCNYYYYRLSGGKYVYGGVTYYDFEVTVTSEGTTSVKPTSITFSSSAVGIEVGETRQLTPTVLPANAECTLTWSINDKSVATISQDGLLTGVSAGAADLKVMADNGVYAMLRVVVSNANPTAVSLPASVSVDVGGYYYLVPTITPSTASTTYTWSTSNSSVATVNSSGRVYGVSPGTATITVKTGNSLYATCTVTVKEEEVVAYAASLVMNDSISIKLGEPCTLTVTITPSVESDSLTFEPLLSSDNENVVSLESESVKSYNGLYYYVVNLIAKTAGEATITITDKISGLQAMCVVEVINDDVVSNDEIADDDECIDEKDETIDKEGESVDKEGESIDKEDETVDEEDSLEDGTAILEAVLSPKGVEISNGTIYLDTSTLVSLYSINGQLIYRGYTNRIERLPCGIYIMHCSGQKKKVVIR